MSHRRVLGMRTSTRTTRPAVSRTMGCQSGPRYTANVIHRAVNSAKPACTRIRLLTSQRSIRPGGSSSQRRMWLSGTRAREGTPWRLSRSHSSTTKPPKRQSRAVQRYANSTHHGHGPLLRQHRTAVTTGPTVKSRRRPSLPSPSSCAPPVREQPPRRRRAR
jgi:hypothetical protein